MSGYLRRGSHLYYVVLTPVYVQAEANEQALLNVLLIAFDIDAALAQDLKQITHGSDFVLVSANDVIASTLPNVRAADVRAGAGTRGGMRRIQLSGQDYLLLGADLRDMVGNRTGELFIIRSFAGAAGTVAELRRTVAVFWTVGLIVALALTYLLSRRVLEPVKRLDRAAEEVTKRNYDYRVPVETNDELGKARDDV